MTSRANNKWTVNELLSLQREYELLGMDIYEIALKHKRTPRAILYKLDDELIINSFSDARGYEQYCLEENIYDSASSVDSDNFDNRLSYLENAVSAIRSTLDIIASRILVKSKSVKEFAC
jgi:hypothetical protein